MHKDDIEEIVGEIADHLIGRFLGRIFQLSAVSLAIDFGLKGIGFLFISVEPANPRLYLIKRQSRELEKRSIPPGPFLQSMRSVLGDARLLSITKDEDERVVRFTFLTADDIGSKQTTLVAQITGRSANLLLVDDEGRITQALRSPRGAGQQIGEHYQPPPASGQSAGTGEQINKGSLATLSAAADEHYLQLEADEGFADRAKTAMGRVTKQLSANLKLEKNLKRDLAQHGDPEQHKRLGDLLLANIANARREGNKVWLTDYYAEGAPQMEIEVDADTSLQDEAGRYFARYTKAKRARGEIAGRLAHLAQTSAQLEQRKVELERIVASGDEAALTLLEGPRASSARKSTTKEPVAKIPGVRRYRSSDGYEILVGRAARTNDQLTFRVARPNDLWLHAADYPGPHVVIRTQTRSEIPHRTIIEAAQLAAKFSQAGNDSKVVVHYTPRKFLSKPKGSAPGLVRMSTFRTIVVAPSESIPRMEHSG